jgi:hypothetical protein
MRQLVLTVVAVAVTVLAAIPAAADDDLGYYLEQASSAEFHGEGIVLCNWDGDSAAARYDVTRSEGMTMATGPSGTAMIAEGLTAIRSGSDWYGLEVEEWAAWRLSDRYTLTDPVETLRLGREALAVTVLEGDVERARLIIDAESTVPLVTEIFDGAGGLYRMAVLVDFLPGPQPMPDSMPDMMEMDYLSRAPDAGALPEDLAGYRLADAYRADEDTVQAFYTDGLFSFSVFEAKRGERPEVFEGATRFEADGEEYRRIVTPSVVWVHWNAPDRTYVLVGDLPPDHLTDVLDELPDPGDRGFLVRLWRRLFG